MRPASRLTLVRSTEQSSIHPEVGPATPGHFDYGSRSNQWGHSSRINDFSLEPAAEQSRPYADPTQGG